MKPEGNACQNSSSTFSTSPRPVFAEINIHINYRAHNCADVAKQHSIGDGVGRNVRILQFPGMRPKNRAAEKMRAGCSAHETWHACTYMYNNLIYAEQM